MSIVVLASDQATTNLTLGEQITAIGAAYRMTLSPHEWVFSDEEQQAMARYVLWAKQRIQAISQLSTPHLSLSRECQPGGER